MKQYVSTICQMCSGRGCGIKVTVENGKIVKVQGDPDNPMNLGGLCAKGLAAIQLEYSHRRLLHPLKRKGDKAAGLWEQIPLDEAIDITANKLNEIKGIYGAQAIAYYKGAGTGWDTPWTYQERFMNLLGSPNRVSHSNLCYVPGMIAAAAVYGPRTQPDYEHANLIIIWGSNPASTGPTFARRVFDAKERGARIIVIDTRFSETASKSNWFIRIRPGTDGALALGMMHVIIKEKLYDRDFVEKWTVGFDKLEDLVQRYPPEKVAEITWVPSDKIIKLAKTYATTKPACIQDGNAFDMHTNAVQSIRSICMLPALTGNLGVTGGETFIPSLQYKDMLLKEKLPKDVQSITRHPLYSNIIQISTPDLINAILSDRPYSIRAMIVQSGCPMMSTPDTNKTREALKKLDFLVVHDCFMTATAELADIVIPAATFLERDLLYKYGTRRPDAYSNLIGLQRKIVEPPGECVSDEGLRIGLARAMGMGEYFPWNSIKDSISEELRPLGLSYHDFEKRGFYHIRYNENDLHRNYEKTGFSTPSGKVEFYSSTFKEHGYDPLPNYKEPAESPISRPDIFREYPLLGDAGTKRTLWTHSQFRTLPWLNEIQAEPVVEIHPEKAKELGIDDGEYVIVESLRGCIKLTAKITKKVGPDLVSVTPGWGQPYSDYNGSLANQLTDQSNLCPVSAAPSIRSFLCRVKKA